MSDLVNAIATFFGQVIGALTKSSFVTTSQTIIMLIFWMLAIGGFLFALRKHAAEHNGTLPELVSTFFRQQYRIVLVWFLVVAAPTMVSVFGSFVASTLRDLPKAIATPTGQVLDQAAQSLRMAWYAQTNIQSNLAADYPNTLDGAQDGISMLADANQAAQALANLKTLAGTKIQAQIQQGQQLANSKNPQDQQRGRDMVAQAKDAKRKLDTAQDLAQVQQQFALGTAVDEVSTLRGYLSGLLHKVNAPLNGVNLAERLACAGVALFMSAPFLLLLIMATWKIIQTFIAMCSHLALYIIISALSASFSISLAPLAMLTYLAEGPSWRKWGDALVSYWLQVLGATVVLAVAIKTLIVPMISALGVGLVQSGTTWFSKIVTVHGIGDGFVISLLAGLGCMALGFVFDLFNQVIQKAPQAAIGPLTGTFHP